MINTSEDTLVTEIKNRFFPELDFNLVTRLKKFDLMWLVDYLAMLHRNNFPFPTTHDNFEAFLNDCEKFQGKNYLELQKELFNVN